MIEADRVSLLAGAPEVVDTPSESGKGQKIARCPACRVALWSHYAGAGPRVSFVRVGTLDAPDHLPPDIHIFTRSKQPWVVLPGDAPAVPVYYDRDDHWPAASLTRRRVLTAQVRVDDLSGQEIRALLDEHLRHMAQLSPPESVHALDIDALRQSDVTFWTAWSDQDLLGCGALKQIDPGHGEVKSMRTTDAFRGLGVARLLLGHIVREARQRGYTALSLETGAQPAFEPARRLYEGFGFDYCGPFAGYAADANSVYMRRVP
jgi:putative acetyltransferase